MNSTITTIMLIFNLITGVISPQECPHGANWQWYEAHGIWACGGEQ
ncbi:hypothetical protein ACXM2N_03385 [Corynebacterium sp. ZY180755]